MTLEQWDIIATGTPVGHRAHGEGRRDQYRDRGYRGLDEPRCMMRGFLSLGSNLGERERLLLKEALQAPGTVRMSTIVKASRLYEISPGGGGIETQDNYLNMVVEVAFEGVPMELLDRCQEVEDTLGRIRPYAHAPRTMDIDILLIDEDPSSWMNG
ncbi:MAG: 2-amino-4-hydroxy-6-hydroxymethyldihydropteridine diphosphokinase [Desulfobacterales bacterium]|nr:2-amino-4-hydroxy-6-hydroxymethyldihydropteridine diphosphokinase [Desulfobacterales bacterium]